VRGQVPRTYTTDKIIAACLRHYTAE
jgi:hypothetical protein